MDDNVVTGGCDKAGSGAGVLFWLVFIIAAITGNAGDNCTATTRAIWCSPRAGAESPLACAANTTTLPFKE